MTSTDLVLQWGIERDFAARLVPWFDDLRKQGLNPVIISGYRDPARQRELRDRWDRGEREGLVARPALDSLHSKQYPDGTPAALAIDVSTTDQRKASSLAAKHGIGAGLYFRNPDPVHYYDPEGRTRALVSKSLPLALVAVLLAGLLIHRQKRS